LSGTGMTTDSAGGVAVLVLRFELLSIGAKGSFIWVDPQRLRDLHRGFGLFQLEQIGRK
jgi:hypothetical protein